MKKFNIKDNKYYWVLIGGALTYSLLTFFAPIRQNPYNLSQLQTRLLQLTIVLPVVGIWWAAIYGGTRFKRYADSIKDSPDGQALKRVATGLLVLAVGLIVAQTFSTLRAYVSVGTEVPAWFRAIVNRISVAFPLTAFFLMWRGSQKLLALTSKKRLSLGVTTGVVVVLAALGFAYANGVINSPTKSQTYALSDTWTISTVIVPFVLSWILGLLAAINILVYSKYTKGVIYKDALGSLVKGVVLVVTFSVVVQLLTASAGIFQGLSLKAILGVVYLLIILFAAGYIVIARGAKKLMSIELAR